MAELPNSTRDGGHSMELDRQRQVVCTTDAEHATNLLLLEEVRATGSNDPVIRVERPVVFPTMDCPSTAARGSNEFPPRRPRPPLCGIDDRGSWVKIPMRFDSVACETLPNIAPVTPPEAVSWTSHHRLQKVLHLSQRCRRIEGQLHSLSICPCVGKVYKGATYVMDMCHTFHANSNCALKTQQGVFQLHQLATTCEHCWSFRNEPTH